MAAPNSITLNLYNNPATGQSESGFDINDYWKITGSGFGNKSIAAYYDDFESRPVGAVSGSVGELNWINSTGSSVSTSSPHSGTKSIVHNYSSNDFPKCHKSLSGASTKFYLSCWLRMSGTVPAGSVWKMGRIGGTSNVYGGNPKAGASYTSSGGVNYPVAFGGEIVSGSPSAITSSAVNMSGTTSTPQAAYIPNTWHFYELEFYTGTVDGNNCFFEERIDKKITARWINRQFLTTAAQNLPEWILTPINGLDNSPPMTYSMDELYITESRSRVIMTDSATFSASTDDAIQPDVFWTDNLIYCAKKRNNFTSGSSAFLHVFVDGVIVNTIPVEVP